MDGWIKLHRSLLDWKYWGDHESLTLWIYLLQMANHKEGWNFRGIKLNPGQLLTGRDKLADACCLHRSKVERILKKLEIEQQIEQQKTNKFRIITIVKWNEYQIGEMQTEQQSEQQMSNKRATNEHIQELKELNKEKNKTISGAKAAADFDYDFFEKVYAEHYPTKAGNKKLGMTKLSKTKWSDKKKLEFEKAVINYANAQKGKNKDYMKQFHNFCSDGCWEGYIEIQNTEIEQQTSELSQWMKQKDEEEARAKIKLVEEN